MQFRLVGLDEPGHAGEHGGFQRVGRPLPRPGQQGQHTGEGFAAEKLVGVDKGADGGDLKPCVDKKDTARNRQNKI